MTHLTTSLTNIRRSPYQSIAAVLLVSLTCFVGFAFSFFLWSSESILKYFESQPQVTAFFSLNASQQLVDSITAKYRAMPGVKDVTLISKESGLKLYQENLQKNSLLLQLVTAEMLPATIGVSTNDPALLPSIKSELEKTPGVEDVIFQGDLTISLLNWTASIRLVGFVCITLLTMSTFGVIVIITGMKVAMRKKSIYIMRILGATRWYVKAPFVYEGAMYGFTGSLIGWGMMYVGYLYLFPWLSEFLSKVPLFPIDHRLFLGQFAVGTAISVLLGATASSFAVGRMMRKAG